MGLTGQIALYTETLSTANNAHSKTNLTRGLSAFIACLAAALSSAPTSVDRS